MYVHTEEALHYIAESCLPHQNTLKNGTFSKEALWFAVKLYHKCKVWEKKHLE